MGTFNEIQTRESKSKLETEFVDTCFMCFYTLRKRPQSRWPCFECITQNFEPRTQLYIWAQWFKISNLKIDGLDDIHGLRSLSTDTGIVWGKCLQFFNKIDFARIFDDRP